MWKNDCCGIYKIENTINHKIYIGQSKHIRERWCEHKKELKRNTHKNIYLQRAWNKYGPSVFVHEILELCDETQLDERECYYINLYETFDSDKGYNLTSGGGRRKKYSIETREKLKINATGANNPNSKKVICLENNRIFDSIGIASKTYNTDPAMIYRCCTGQRLTAGNVHWMYLNNYEISSEEEIKLKLKQRENKVVIYLNTKEVFDSITEASKKTGVNMNSISLCCNHHRQRAGCTSDGIPRVFMFYDEFLSNDEIT